MKHALEYRDEIAGRIAGRRVSLFLDYDGTLTPIVQRPEDAVLSDEMREVLVRVASRYLVTIVSGRDRRDAQALVGLENLYFAGSHGFDISGPDGMDIQQEDGQRALGDLDEAEARLSAELGSISGAQVERKKYAIAIHYRNAAEEDVNRIRAAVEAERQKHPSLRMRGGKKIFELQPDVDWDKGRAVMFLRDVLGLQESFSIYIGDDVTDEDVFKRLRGQEGLGVRVGRPDEPTAAEYLLKDTQEVGEFLAWLAGRGEKGGKEHE